jgi:L-asparaginase
MNMRSKPRVVLIGTGGTISSIGRESLDLWEYMDASRKAEPDELLVRFPEVAEAAEIVCVRFRAMSSAAVGPADWLALDAAVHAAVSREAPLDGVVITHGTATLEETAYFLNLTLKVDTTVVLVRSQRPVTGLSSDAGLNLLNAVGRRVRCPAPPAGHSPLASARRQSRLGPRRSRNRRGARGRSFLGAFRSS